MNVLGNGSVVAVVMSHTEARLLSDALGWVEDGSIGALDLAEELRGLLGLVLEENRKDGRA
jgi:hypothetical protein